jgi:ubiquinone/menaquinone biosynthesis C-methylase UbiE
LHSVEQREAWLELLAGLAEEPPKRVLDVGCGTGFLALMFAQLGHSVTGVDLAGDMLSLARQKSAQAHQDVIFRLENAASLSDPDESYDLVVARHVIWTMPDPARAVAEWLRVLRPGGRLALVEGKWASNESKDEQSGRTESKLADIVHAAAKIISRLVRRKRQRRGWTYRRIEAQLPFSGGPPAERLVAFLEERGLRDVAVEPLMSPALWGERPQFPRYLVVGKR